MEIDGYLSCEAYEGHNVSPVNGFTTFTDANGENYFSMIGLDGSVILRSEGYPTFAARDNGLASVQKNREIKERYKIIEDDGKWYVTLKAGNHQEIARSCPFDTEDAAWARFSFLKEGSTDDFTWNIAPVASIAAESTKIKAENVEDDYLVCSEYRERIADSKLADSPDFIAFQHQNGKFYFGVLDAQGELILRSEGYPSKAARDNGIASVKKNREIESRWSTEEIRGFTFDILKASNGQEIARSCPQKEGQAAAAVPNAIAATGTLAAAGAAAINTENTLSSENLEDDYLVCSDYRDRIVDSRIGNTDFAAFQHQNGKYYFAMLNAQGELSLRSEGYPTAAARDNGIESVKKNREIESRWSTEEKRGFFFNILKAGNGLEIARSCPSKTAAALGGLGYGALAAAAAIAAPIAAKSETITNIEKKVADKAAPIAESYAAVDETSAAGGWGWLKWLLGALLLAALLWWLMRSCKKTEGTEAETVSTVLTDTTAVENDTNAVAAAAVANNICNCSGNEEAIFNIPTDKVAKKLPRLGTNPEFARYGDIHAMDAAKFLAFLNERASTSSADKTFLDRIAKAMGYASGFGEVTADKVSEHVFPIGTKGNLGWGAAHNTAYDELPDAERDRMAFKIAGNGGCDIYFMKTCGNHMVPSTNCD